MATEAAAAAIPDITVIHWKPLSTAGKYGTSSVPSTPREAHSITLIMIMGPQRVCLDMTSYDGDGGQSPQQGGVIFSRWHSKIPLNPESRLRVEWCRSRVFDAERIRLPSPFRSRLRFTNSLSFSVQRRAPTPCTRLSPAPPCTRRASDGTARSRGGRQVGVQRSAPTCTQNAASAPHTSAAYSFRHS